MELKVTVEERSKSTKVETVTIDLGGLQAEIDAEAGLAENGSTEPEEGNPVIDDEAVVHGAPGSYHRAWAERRIKCASITG